MSEKSNHINGLRNNVHNTDEMKRFVVDLWMKGTSAHVIDRMARSKVGTVLRARREARANKKQQTALQT
jgi:transposase-like protein